MKIDDELITYLEDISLLAFSPDEKKRLTADLGKIMDGMAPLAKLDAGPPFDDGNDDGMSEGDTDV